MSEPEWDYGQGKTRDQEARDSQLMLGMVVSAGLLAILVITLLLIFL